MNRSIRVNLYDILDVPISATSAEIKTAFRSLAMKHHPDKHYDSPESTALFKTIHNAYSVLSNRESRQRYDRVLGAARSSDALRRGSSERRAPPVPLHSPPAATVALLLGHLNFVLWDIEDLLAPGRRPDKAAVSGGTEKYVSMMLSFIDRWVLVPAGLPDYFYQARGLDPPAQIGGSPELPSRRVRGEHRPYADMTDYFYDIRRRVDELFRRARLADFSSPIPEKSLTLADCIIEAHNYCVHYLGGMNEEAAPIPAFRHSNPMFERADRTR